MINYSEVLLANTVAIILMLLLLPGAYKTSRYKMMDSKLFRTMVWMTICLAVLEVLSFFLDGKTFPSARILNLLSNVSLYIVDIIFVSVWVLYVDFKLFGNIDRQKKLYPFFFIPAAAVILGCLINLFTPVFFSVSQDNVYSRTSFAYICYVVTYSYLLYGSIRIYLLRNKVQKYTFLPVVYFILPIVIGSIIQMFNYGISLIWLSTSIGMVSLYINIQNEEAYVDVLSGLFTRPYLNRYLTSETRKNIANSRFSGIMLDIDNFKNINDTYGHQMGDDVISQMGAILHKAIGNGFGARYGGDEFVLFLWVHKEAEVKDIIARITNGVQAHDRTEKFPFELCFSVGYSFFDSQCDTVDSFLNHMDKAMYKNKHDPAKA